MSASIEIQRTLYAGTDDECTPVFTAEAEVTQWFGGSIEDWDFVVYDEEGEKATDIRLTHDEICRLYAKLSEEENEPRRRYGG